MKQREKRNEIDVDINFTSVSSVTHWYRSGHFSSKEEALGAFKLAYQQGMDGMGKSPENWMGLSEDEFIAWMKHDALPPKQ